MKDWRKAHEQEGEKLFNKGFRIIAENVGIDELVLSSRRHKYPKGSIWLWGSQQVWAPPSVEPQSAAE